MIQNQKKLGVRLILKIVGNTIQGCNHRENLVATSAMVGRIKESVPRGRDRVKLSENLGANTVAPFTPVDTSLQWGNDAFIGTFQPS